ncbi:MAG: hypothetical protein ABL940_10095 [Bacteroidia bacterium]
MKHVYSPSSVAFKKQLFSLLSIVLIGFTSIIANAQNNVGIGTTTPNNKAILELQATDKGFLAPRLTTPQMNLIAPAATESGLLIYNTDSACYHFYNGTAWKNLCDNSLDTAVLNKAIKNYLGGVNFTTVINNLSVDSSVTNVAVINNATINNLTVDSSVTNVAVINNATINNLTVDSSVTNVAVINNATINNLTVDSSVTNVAVINNATINNLTVDSSSTNYAYINNANINNLTVDSSVANYSEANHFQGGWASMDSLQIGGQNIMTTISDSITAQAWLLKGNSNVSATNVLGTLNPQNLRIVANGAEKITIAQGTGNVGVNQPLPSQQLDVVGNVQFSGALMPNGSTGTTGQLLTSNGAGSPTWTSASSINTNTIAGTGTTAPLLVLNGIADIAYKNATAQGVILVDPSSGCWKLTVSTTGALVTQSVTCP